MICVGTVCALRENTLIGPILADLDPTQEHLGELVSTRQGEFAGEGQGINGSIARYIGPYDPDPPVFVVLFRTRDQAADQRKLVVRGIIDRT